VDRPDLELLGVEVRRLELTRTGGPDPSGGAGGDAVEGGPGAADDTTSGAVPAARPTSRSTTRTERP
jgi:hypothetical protein